MLTIPRVWSSANQRATLENAKTYRNKLTTITPAEGELHTNSNLIDFVAEHFRLRFLCRIKRFRNVILHFNDPPFVLKLRQDFSLYIIIGSQHLNSSCNNMVESVSEV